MWGISYPGFYTSAGMIDAHPALKAASPQAPIADWFIGDDFHHNGAFYLPHAFRSSPASAVRGPGRRPVAGSRFDFGTDDGYQFYLKLGPLPNANARHFKGEIAFWNELMAHETYDAFWQAREPAAAPEEHQARRHDGGRLVRRGGPVRRPRDLQERRAPEPRRVEHARHGALGPRRLVAAATATASATCASGRRPPSSTATRSSSRSSRST